MIRENGAVDDIRWVNPHQPQTLYMGVILSYLDAALGLLGFGLPYLVARLIVPVGLAAGGFGVANEKKWGYGLAVGAAILQVLTEVVILGSSTFTDIGNLFAFVFDVALVALLLHPMSRDYQRIWFR